MPRANAVMELAARPRASGPVVPLTSSLGDDEQLLEGIIQRRPAAIAELFNRLAGSVRRTLIRTLGSPVDVEDLAQETFLIAIRRAHTLRDVNALSSFVIGIAVRTARNELRKRALRRFVGFSADDGAMTADALVVDPLAREGVARVYRALERMDATARVLFVLRHVEQLELSELAQALDISLATVKRKLARAEQRFEAIAAADPVLCAYLRGEA